MHLLIPFAAALSDAGQEAAARVDLPHLARLVATWAEVANDTADETSLSPPHERALAAAWGWPVDDGLLPLAAVAASDDGLAIAADETGWALISPTHWQTTTDRVALTDPADLALDETSARELHAALQPLFADQGWVLRWGAPTRWYAGHRGLAALPTASLDRVAGRHLGPWLSRDRASRSLRRLQVEAQMTLHAHPTNVERESRGLPAVNSFWASGTGPTRPIDASARRAIRVDTSLRTAALAEDWAAWSTAWQRLDAGALRTLLDARSDAARLTLGGERSALTFAPRKRPVWRRWFGARSGESSAALGRL